VSAVVSAEVGQNRRFGERGPNGRFPMRERSLQEVITNDRSWPVSALGAPGRPMTGMGQNQPFAEQWPNDRRLTCRWMFGETPANDRFWPNSGTEASGTECPLVTQIGRWTQ